MSLLFVIGMIFFLFLAWIMFSIVIWTIKNGISPMPTSAKAKQIILKAVPESGDIYELGAGWGTLAFALAAKFPDRKIEAYETSPVPYLFCKMRQWMTPYPNLQFHRQDFFEISLKEASVAVCYLYPGAMHRLKSKFEKELSPNSTVISHTFSIPGWDPRDVFVVPDLYRTHVFVYIVFLDRNVPFQI